MRIVIIVRGGVVDDVLADEKDVEVMLIDWDNIAAGESRPVRFAAAHMKEQVDCMFGDPKSVIDQLISDAAEAEEKIPLDELEQFASEQRQKKEEP